MLIFGIRRVCMNTYPENSQMVKTGRQDTIPWHKKLFILRNSARSNPLCNNVETLELIENLKNARNEWMNANINFDYVSEQEIIDYYTYQIKACEIRYEYYLKKAKEIGIKAEMLEESYEMLMAAGNRIER
jgi:hypothetical protein